MYLQHSLSGSAVILYLEAELAFAEWLQAIATSHLEIDRRFIDLLADIHDIDVRQPAAGPPPHTIGEWVDQGVMPRRKGLAFMAKLRPWQASLPPEDQGATDTFAHDAYVVRRPEFIDSRRAIGQNAEVVTVSVLPTGPVICGYLEAADPVDANRRLVASDRPYDVWFKDHLKYRFPPELDFSQPLPPIEPLFDYVSDIARV